MQNRPNDSINTGSSFIPSSFKELKRRIPDEIAKIIFISTSIVGIGLTALVVQAGSWDNFKLKYFHLTSYLHNQERELEDIRQKNLKPESNSRIDLKQLINGGPPKDGIPSIDNPQFNSAANTPFSSDELAIGVVVNGEAKAYPLGIMNWHEIVNDTIGGMNVTVSYCPLCDTIVVFKRGNTTFGVSGKLYQSCLVMYDRRDDTLYAQPWSMGIVGEKVNHHQERIPAVKTTLGAWLKEYPDSQILSSETGYNRDYQRYPYGDYYTNNQIIFPVRNQEQLTLNPKAIVSYIWRADGHNTYNRFSGASYQFAHEQIEQIGEKIIEFKGREIKASWDDQLNTVIVEAKDGTVIPSSTAFAFVYPAYFGK